MQAENMQRLQKIIFRNRLTVIRTMCIMRNIEAIT